MKRMMQPWDVKLWWCDARGACESGVNSSWPAGTSPMKVIEDVAEWRRVDLRICYDVHARQIGEPYAEEFLDDD